MNLQDFKNKYGLNGLYAKPVEYMGSKDVTEEVFNDVKRILDEVILTVKSHYSYSTSQINEITTQCDESKNDLIKIILGEIKINIY